LVTGQRDATTVPTQSLFMLNSPFVRRQALILAGNLLSPEYSSDDARIREAYERVLGRAPKPHEAAEVKAFLSQYSATWEKTHPDSPASGVARAAPVAFAGDTTAGVVRSDGLTQDTEILDVAPPKEDPSLTVIPGSAAQAAWGAFVQALYGSAEFQYVR